MNFGDTYGVLMRLHEIERWSMVPICRRQSVAEHTFRVMLIARAIYDCLYPVPHNSDDSTLLDKWAMWHDADEYWLTDLPSIVKKAIKEEAGEDIFERLVAKKFRYMSPQYLELRRGVTGTTVELIVKIADITETMAYFNEYVTDSRYTGTGYAQQTTLLPVYKYLDNSLRETITRLRAHPMIGRAVIGEEFSALILEAAYTQNYRVKLMEVRHPGYGQQDPDALANPSIIPDRPA